MHELASRALFAEAVKAIEDSVLKLRDWQLITQEFPMLEIGFRKRAVLNLRVRLRCDDWNEVPPSIEICDSQGNLVGAMPHNLGGILNMSAHPSTGKPFICMRGTREYHTHPSHTTDAWATIEANDAFTLGGIVTQIWHAWSKVSV